MRLKIDKENDVLYFRLDEAEIVDSEEVQPGVILDYDTNGNLVSLEILDASRRVSVPSKIEYQVSPMAG